MSAERELAGFIAKFTPQMAKLIRAARKKLQRLVPGALELVYDNYNFLVIAYGPSERPGELILSLGAYAKGLNLFFAHGKTLPDPKKLLRGTGARVRSLRVESPATLDDPGVKALVKAAVAGVPFGKRRLVIKLVSKKQRPRR